MRWHGAVINRSDDTVVVEGNHYFSSDEVSTTLLRPSNTTARPWKGTTHCYSLIVDDAEYADAMWYYADPRPEAEAIRDPIAFWKYEDRLTQGRPTDLKALRGPSSRHSHTNCGSPVSAVRSCSRR